MKKWLIATGVIVLIGIFVVLNLRKDTSKVEVKVTEVKRRDITKLISASGRIEPRRQVNVSASAIGKITRLAVKEGDRVKKGDFLLQIDPTDYQTTVEQLQATLRAASATLEMEQASLRKAEYDLERAETLREKDMVSEQELRNARVEVDVLEARVRSARETVAQYGANLKKASHDLDEVRITADMAGVITELNVEEGENAIMGTLNNPGTVLLVIADLSEIEAEVEVDETEVVFVRVGQGAIISLDAYPDSAFAGTVTEVGNSAIRTQLGLGQSSVDFKVVISVDDEIPYVRPGLSASVKVKVAEEHDVISVPIQCLTVRRQSDLEEAGVSLGDRPTGINEDTGDEENGDVEGVFVVEDGKAAFRPVSVGIAGRNYFEVREGLDEGDVVVSGSFKAINELKHGDPVKAKQESSPDS